MTSDTLRTDSVSIDLNKSIATCREFGKEVFVEEYVPAKFSRELERELTTANETIARLTVQVKQADARGDEAMRRAHEAESQLATKEAELLACRADADRINAIAAEYWKVDTFSMPTGGDDADVGWRISQYHMGTPAERVVVEVYEDDLRAAIDAAIKAGAQS